MFSERTARRLRDIVDDGDEMQTLIAGLSFDTFVQDRRTVLAVERLLQRITEAVIQIGPDDMTLIDPTLSVVRLRALGNRLRHEYWDIELPTIFAIASVDVPALRDAAARALDD